MRARSRLVQLGVVVAVVLTETFAVVGVASATAVPKNSTTFAGYQASVAGQVTVTTTFAVPAVKCGSAYEAAYLLAGAGSGKSRVSSGVLVECNGGTRASYTAVIEWNKFQGAPASSTWTSCCAVGDVITATVTFSPSGSGSASYDDQTSNVSHALSNLPLAASTKAMPAFVGVSNANPADPPPAVADFHKVKFSSSLINAASLHAARAKPFQQVTAANVTQITVGALGQAGTLFTATFVHS